MSECEGKQAPVQKKENAFPNTLKLKNLRKAKKLNWNLRTGRKQDDQQIVIVVLSSLTCRPNEMLGLTGFIPINSD